LNYRVNQIDLQSKSNWFAILYDIVFIDDAYSFNFWSPYLRPSAPKAPTLEA